MSTAKVDPSEVDLDSVYAVQEFRRRVGWGVAAYRQAKRNGLRVRRVHGRVYVTGRDFFSYLDQQAVEDIDEA